MAGLSRGKSSLSSSLEKWNKQSVAWIFGSPMWRAIIGTPLVALNALLAIPLYLMGPSSFFKSVDRSKTVFPPIMEGLESRFVQVNGIQLHVMATNPDPSKPLMLFLHGYPEFWYCWRHQLKHFSKEYQVAALDMRGYNLSDKPQGVDNYTIDKVAADVKAVVPALGHKKCILVGHDWGAVIAWSTAALHPETVDQVVGLAVPPIPQFLRKMTPAQAVVSNYMLLMTFYPRIVEILVSAHDFDFVRALMVKEAGAKNVSAEDVERHKQALQRPGAVQASIEYYRALWSITAQDRSNPVNQRVCEAKVRQPALMLFGEREAFLREEVFEDLEDVVPHVSFQKIDCGHFMQYEKPDLVNSTIEQWLASIKAPAQT